MKQKMNNSIKQWHFFISGFTENRQQSTGLQKAWKTATTTCPAKNLHSTVFFPVLPWNHNWYQLARFVQINSQQYKDVGGGGKLVMPPPKINIYAYSWGAGYGAINLAQNLDSIANYEIQNMVLADPVYCSTSFFMRWRAIFAGRFDCTRKLAPKITIPSNTHSVYWSRQFNDWPRAHNLYSLPASRTVIHPPNLELNLSHSEMDEATWFQDKVQELCNA